MSHATFIKDIIKIDKDMGLEILKAIVYSAVQRKYTMEYSIDYGYYTKENPVSNIPFIETRRMSMKEIINEKPLPIEYIHKCIWFVHEYLCDKDYWKPFRTHDLLTYDDEEKIKALIKYISYKDGPMQHIYKYITRNWDVLVSLFEYLRNDYFKKQFPIKDVEILPIEYNSGADTNKRCYKIYNTHIDMILNKNVDVIICYGRIGKSKINVDMLFDLKTLMLSPN